MKKTLFFIVLILFMLIPTLVLNAEGEKSQVDLKNLSSDPSDLVVFNDNNLRNEVGRQLGIDPATITEQDMLNLKYFGINDTNLTDLTGLEYALNLERLSIYSLKLEDLAPISNLTKLTRLNLESNNITNVDPLANLVNLQYLNLSYNKISDISKLNNLVNLEELYLRGNKLSSIDVVSNFNKLNIIAFSFNDVSDISPLQNNTNLTVVEFMSNNVEDISPLRNLTNLTSLSMYDNKISDLEPLSGLINLQKLDADSNDISSVEPLKNLVNLENLGLGFNNITDISPLQNLTKMKRLSISSNDITDIKPVSYMHNLVSLHAYYTKVQNMDEIVTLKDLVVLNVENTNLDDISFITELPNLNDLSANFNNITEIPDLSNNSKLEILTLMNNNISDISNVANTNLQVLHLNNNNISDISPIGTLNNLLFVGFHDQEIQLPDLEVTSGDEVFYEVTNYDGSKISVSLGYPTNVMETHVGNWSVLNGGALLDYTFSGTVTQNIIQKVQNELTSDTDEQINEENPLSDNDLISLFNVKQSNNQDINVDQSNVDYTKPGTYTITFSSKDTDSIDVNIHILDVLPKLIITPNELTINKNSKLETILSKLEIKASEINDGDLNKNVLFNDFQIIYNKPGKYVLKASVKDEEGNIVNTEVAVNIDDYVIDVSHTENTNGLSQTGNNMSYIIYLVIIVVICFFLKYKLTRK